MSALSIAALAATAALTVAIGCVVYVVISFRRSADLIASRVGRRPRALFLVATTSTRRTRPQARTAPAHLPLRVRVS
jgi:hypothetical protein